MLKTQANGNLVECLAWKGRYWSLNLAYWILEKCGVLDFLNKVKDNGRARARDTATYMNMTFDLDTDPHTNTTYEDTTEEAFVVVSQVTALISYQIEHGTTEVIKV